MCVELRVTSLKEACNLGCEFARECLLPTQQVRAELHPGSPPTHTPILPRHPVHTSAAAVPSVQGPLHSRLYPPECSFYEPQCLQDTTQGRAPTSVEWGEGKNASVFMRNDGHQCSSFPALTVKGSNLRGMTSLLIQTSSSSQCPSDYLALIFLQLALPCKLSRSRPFKAMGTYPLVGLETHLVCGNQNIFPLKGSSGKNAAFSRHIGRHSVCFRWIIK